MTAGYLPLPTWEVTPQTVKVCGFPYHRQVAAGLGPLRSGTRPPVTGHFMTLSGHKAVQRTAG
jgi:hypothetical protein